MDTDIITGLKNAITNKITELVSTHNNDNSSHSDIRTNLDNKINKSVTTGLVKNDGTIDTNTYLKDITVISDEEDIINDGIYLEIESNNNYVVATVTGNSVTIGNNEWADNPQWLGTIGDVTIDWGDGTSDIVNNPTQPLSHTYTDEESEHNITFRGCVINLKERCFIACHGLTSIIIPDSVTTIEKYCFSSCENLTSVIIPSSVTSLGEQCFAYCTSLASVTIPSTLTSLPLYCFINCTSLTSIIIPSSVTSLGQNCFRGCSGLISITIPNDVVSLGTYCFYRCSSLTNYQLYWTGNNIITYNSNKMPNNTNSTFTIPVGETANYVAKGYPSDKLTERGA